MSKTYLFITLCLLCAACGGGGKKSWTDYVDTRVGTAPSATMTSGMFGKNTEELGQTIPAVLAPNGMNFWTPQTRDTELKCVAPYYYDDTELQGFRNSHWITGGCTQDYGSMTLMPLAKRLRCSPAARASAFSHDDEIAKPHYYSAYLSDEGIKAEMTGTSRAAIFRFTYDNAGPGFLVVNPNSDEGQGFIAIDTAQNMIYGYNPAHRIYQGKGEPAGFAGHFVVAFDKKIKECGSYIGETPLPGVLSIGNKPSIGCYLAFDVEDGEQVLAKAASSFTSHEGALNNLQAEIPGWDFDAVQQALADTWQDHLGKIEAETDNEADLNKFYSAFYRASFLPREVNDADGKYPSFASGYPVRELPDGVSAYYDDFSMWDTYRALHPFINLMFPTKGGEMMQSLVCKYEQGGWMPIFPCWNSYTAAMIGDHAASAIADAYVKGIDNFDVEKAYEGLRKNAFDLPSEYEYLDGKGRRALQSYLQYGYIPLEDSVPNAYHKKEQVSRTLEYAYDDFALSQLANLLVRPAVYNALRDRSLNYLNVINPATGYADGRYADGSWADDDPFAFTKHITEGAPCHYTWYAPHDPYGLMEAMGGETAFVAKLDSMFSEGRYWHGNEPCHQVAFMYNFAGEPWKTSRAVRHIMETEYLDAPGGLAGNDDAGQMSAWYLFAALGFYPVCPGTPYYMISGPTFKSATLHLENGKELKIKAPKASDKNIYVKSMKFNGEEISQNYIEHSKLMEGGLWEFEMTDEPVGTWGTGKVKYDPAAR